MNATTIVPMDQAKAGDIVIPLYESRAVVTSVYPYRGLYPQWFTHVVNYTYCDTGVRSGTCINRRGAQ